MGEKTPAKLTELQRTAIVEEYYSTATSQPKLAEKYGVSVRAINKILSDPKRVKKFERKVDLWKERAKLKNSLAQLKAVDAAPDAMDQIVKIAQQQVTKDNMPYQYVIQNACMELLNRAGVKPKASEEDNEIVIRFADASPAGQIDLGMPED